MPDSTRRSQLFAIRLSLAIGLLMLGGKWLAYLMTDSAAILSDAAESVVHVAAVAFAFYSMWLSHQPPDASHPYGHGKITYFSAGIEGLLIMVAAAFIIVDAAGQLLSPIVLRNLGQGTLIIAGASVVNLALGWYLVRRGRKYHSLILVANGKHVLTDSWTSFGVVGGLALTIWTGWLPFDPLIAIAVAINIVWSGVKLIRESVAGLMDEGDPELQALITRTLDREASDRGLRYHRLRYRKSGQALWIEFHLLFPRQTLLEHAHRTATDVERALATRLPMPAEILTHLESFEDHAEGHDKGLD
jgi:cation diffusion facilitator family transporter